MTDTTAIQPRTFKFSWTDSFLWAIRVMAIFVIVWGFIGAIALGLEGNGLSAEAWKQLIVSGVAQGSMYGLLALGYSMVYGVLGFINFAHGEVFMVGAMVGFFAADALFEAGLWEANFILSIFIVLLVAMFTSTFTAVLIEKIAYQPLRNAPRLIPLITSIGVSFFIQNAMALLVGPAFRTYPAAPSWLSDPVSLFGIDVPGTTIAVFVITFISMVGSEFVQKYLGEGPRMVRDVFRLARENSPCVIFIDEIDAIATKRFDAQTGADREVQRILLELLNQMDGFEEQGQVKMVMATNRPDILDPALLRPGRLDRKIEIPEPNETQRLEILKIHSASITKRGDIDFESIVKLADGLNGADMRNVCTEAGLFAIRGDRDYVLEEDFMKAARKILDNKKLESRLDYSKV